MRNVHFWRAYIGLFLIYLASGITVPFFPLLIEEKGGSYIHVSLAVLTFATTYVIFNLLWGYPASILDWRLLLLPASAVIAYLYYLYPHLSISGIIKARLVEGVFFSLYYPILSSLASASLKKEEKELGMSTLRSAGSFGWGTGSLIGGIASYKFGIPAPFLGAAVAFIFLTTLVLFFFSSQKHVKLRTLSLEDFRNIDIDPRFLAFAFGIFFFVTANYAYETFVSLFIKSMAGSEMEVGYAFGIKSLIEGVSMILIPYLFGWTADIFMISLGMILYSIIYTLVSFAVSPYQVIIMRILEAVPFAMIMGTAIGTANKLAKKENLVLYNTIFSFLSSKGLPAMVGSITGGFLVQNFGFSTAFKIVSLFPLIGVIILLITFMPRAYYRYEDIEF